MLVGGISATTTTLLVMASWLLLIVIVSGLRVGGSEAIVVNSAVLREVCLQTLLLCCSKCLGQEVDGLDPVVFGEAVVDKELEDVEGTDTQVLAVG